ncbi:MAG: hypothetical protein WDM96_12285 [Lacunisphaera sp.]
MTIDEIREQIAISMDMHGTEIWFGVLDHTDPGHYGVEDVEFQIDPKDIWVDIPTKAFTFKKGTLSFSARLMSTRDGLDKDCSFTVSGSGKFEFAAAGKIDATEFRINEQLDLIDGSSRPIAT